MPLRARDAHKLASLLTTKSGASVRIHYDRQAGCYRVAWVNGPDTAQMYTLAMTCAPELSRLDPSSLVWDRHIDNPRT